MRKKRPRKSHLNLYILGLAIFAAAIAGYFLPTKRPESGVTLTPKEYIELVEQKKQQRKQFQAGDKAQAPQHPPEAKDTQ